MGKGFGCFFLGLGIGAAVGMLLAPQSGEETRDKLLSRADEGKDFLKKQTEGLRDSATDILGKGREVLNRQRDSLNDAIEAGKQAYRDKIDHSPMPSQPV